MIGTLALAGIFPFAGFWSKDEILADAFLKGVEDGGLVGAGAFIALGMLLIAAGFTAFYMWRQMELVFYGDHRHDAAAHAPESAPSMILPLLVLAFFSLTIGFMNTPSGIGLAWIAGGAHRFADWIIVSVQHAHVGVFLPAAGVGCAFRWDRRDLVGALHLWRWQGIRRWHRRAPKDCVRARLPIVQRTPVLG
ncbi:MAG UNVERIFIED_CONTAM: hypothetical protein LVT10_25700 [Anaerolineae bacterium]